MASSSTHQLLLNTATNTKPNVKILVFTISLFAIIFCSALLTSHLIKVRQSSPSTPQICNQAHDPQECLSILSEAVSTDGVQESNGAGLLKNFPALADCLELMDMSIDRVTDTLSALANWGSQSDASDANTWLSGVLTNHFTCLDGVDSIDQPPLKNLLQDLISRMRASLAVVASLSASDSDLVQPLNGGFPSWILGKDRKILESSVGNVEANVVVAQDGSGDYTTVQEAVNSAPDKSQSQYVIHVKSGIYKENVEVGKNKKNVTIVGDGMDFTILTGSLNVVDGSTTFRSATLAVAGDGFILQDIWIQNTAGPEKHQAVALRVSADQSVINRCRIDAYQDTLYTHNYRQFYRDCSIIGTVDFIFGNGAVVIQSCQIISRKPMAKPEEHGHSTRPWKEYSRTVVMQSDIGGHIDPTGWAEWNKDFALRTLYYGEYANRGPGAGVSKRVNWPGYHVITDPNEAKKFTVAELIQGGTWLGSTGVSFTEGL
ncbi:PECTINESTERASE [Salix viminalis]|uniref:Pectinesterase n=1 Tax=Salix viminalis TaxID=40686 RepID=A0A9Q0Z7S8_SALVM|nr:PECTINESTERASE [Salix viminalis]